MSEEQFAIWDLRKTYLEPSKLRTISFDVNLDGLEEGYKKALPKLFRACDVMNELFLTQDHPQSLKIKKRLLKRAEAGNEDARVALDVFNMFNGPVGVTEESEPAPLFQGVKPRPKGGTLYTEGITAEEIETYLKKHPEKRAEFEKINTIIQRKGKGLTAIPYEKKYRRQLNEAAKLLESAAEDVPSQSFSQYLKLRAKALVSGNFFKSDVAWVNSTDGPIDCVIGPLESYYDGILGKKAFYAGSVTIKDDEETKKVSAYSGYLQELEDRLPQDKSKAKDMSKVNVPLSVVNIIYMAGDRQAKRPGVTAAQILPNDEKVLKKVGRKILLFKNVSDGIEPNRDVLDRLVEPELHKYIKNKRGDTNAIVGHEHSHDLGPEETSKFSELKTVVEIVSRHIGPQETKRKDKKGKPITVRDAMGFWDHPIEELKADLAGMYNAPYLASKGLYTEEEVKEIYSNDGLFGNLPLNKPDIYDGKHAHRTRELMKFNYFLRNGGIVLRDGKFCLEADKLPASVENMLREVLAIQDKGDKEAAEQFVKKWAVWSDEAQYASRVMKECKPKFYNKVEQPTAEALLRGEAR